MISDWHIEKTGLGGLHRLSHEADQIILVGPLIGRALGIVFYAISPAFWDKEHHALLVETFPGARVEGTRNVVFTTADFALIKLAAS